MYIKLYFHLDFIEKNMKDNKIFFKNSFEKRFLKKTNTVAMKTINFVFYPKNYQICLEHVTYIVFFLEKMVYNSLR